MRKLAVETPRLTQTTRFDLSGPTASADTLDTQLFISGGVEADQTSSLLTPAANICYAHWAWKIPVQPAVTVWSTVADPILSRSARPWSWTVVSTNRSGGP